MPNIIRFGLGVYKIQAKYGLVSLFGPSGTSEENLRFFEDGSLKRRCKVWLFRSTLPHDNSWGVREIILQKYSIKWAVAAQLHIMSPVKHNLAKLYKYVSSTKKLKQCQNS